MTYVITEPCIGVKDASCVDVCPVDCIHATDDDAMYFIDPDECIDCGACEPECPVTAIFAEDAVPDDQVQVHPDQRRLLQAVADAAPGRPLQPPRRHRCVRRSLPRRPHADRVALSEPPRRPPDEAGRGGRAPSPFYLMAEMAFDSAADLDAALTSEAGAESARDLRNFAGAGVTMFIAPDEADA